MLSARLSESTSGKNKHPAILKGLAAAVAAALAAPAVAAEIPFQAESGTTLTGFSTANDQDASPTPNGPYITTSVNNTTAPPAGSLPTENAQYNLNFPEAGNYVLYARVLAYGEAGTGANQQGGNDSMFVPTALGPTPNFTVSNGYDATTPDQDRARTLGSGATRQTVYHWVNTRTGQGLEHGATLAAANRTPLYNVAAPGAQTFVLGGREDGLRLDAFVFSTNAGLTANQLNSLVGVTVPTFTFPADAPMGGAGTMGVREIREGTGGGLTNQDQANAKLNSPPADAFRADYQAPFLNILDSGGDGRFPNNQLFRTDPNQTAQGTDTVNNIAVLARGTVRIPAGQGGRYTFGVNSDDGFTLLFPGKDFDGTTINNGATVQYTQGRALHWWGGKGVSDTMGQIDLPEGDHEFILQHHEGGGGAAVELFSARGAHGAFNLANFNLVGNTTPQTYTRKAPTVTAAGFDVVNFNNVTDPDGTGPMTALDAAVARYAAFRSDPVANPHNGRETHGVIQYADPEGAGTHRAGQGDYPAIRPFPGNTAADDNNFATGARGTINITDAGRYTFDVLADDSIRFRIFQTDGQDVDLVATAGGAGNGGINTDADAANDAFRTTGCCADALGTYDLAAGDYTVELIHQEGGGGSSLSLYAASGQWSFYDPLVFQLLGQNLATSTSQGAPGLELVPEPGTAGLLAVAGLGLLARRRRRA